MLSTRDHFRPSETYGMKVRERKKIFHGSRNQKKAAVAILISDKIVFKIKTYKTQRRTLPDYLGSNSSRKLINCKYILTQNRSTAL